MTLGQGRTRAAAHIPTASMADAAPYGAMVGVRDALQRAGATRIALGVWDR